MTGIRAARPDDAVPIARLHADSWRRHYRGTYSDAFLDGAVEADRHAVWSARLADPAAGGGAGGASGAGGAGGAVTLVAEDPARDPALVGFVHVIPDEDPRWGSLVDNLHVVADRHRGGLGARLLTAGVRGAAARAASGRVYLWVLRLNTAAQGFYTRFGGRVVAEEPVGAPGGNPANLAGAPTKLRVVWDDAELVAKV